MAREDMALQDIRKSIYLTACCGGIGHLASAFSIVEILYALYFMDVLQYDAKNPEWSERDRLILSKGHGSLAMYAVLSRAGFFPSEELQTFSCPGSRLGGEPSPLEVPGIEAATGSLGHGLSIGAGMALAMKMDGNSGRVYVILGDGECQEGSIWEAAMVAAGQKLGNLTAILDQNRIQKMGFVQDVIGPVKWKEKWEAFGWRVQQVDGHDVHALYESLLRARQEDAPQMIITDTVKGKGLSFMENNPVWHYRMPNRKETKKVMEELGITEEELIKCKRPS